jgi:hypothetical protein
MGPTHKRLWRYSTPGFMMAVLHSDSVSARLHGWPAGDSHRPSHETPPTTLDRPRPHSVGMHRLSGGSISPALLPLKWARVVSNHRPLACEVCRAHCRLLRYVPSRLQIDHFGLGGVLRLLRRSAVCRFHRCFHASGSVELGKPRPAVVAPPRGVEGVDVDALSRGNVGVPQPGADLLDVPARSDQGACMGVAQVVERGAG